MIGLFAEDGLGAIELFPENDAGEVMRKGYGAEGPTGVGLLFHLIREAPGASEGETHGFLALVHPALEVVGHLFRRDGASLAVEDDEVVVGAEGLEDPLALFGER